MHTRERLLAIEPRDRGMLAYSLRSHDEVRDAGEAFEDIPAAKPDAEMIEIATKIIDQKEGPFDPSQFTDRYEDALKALIRAKEKGGKRTVKTDEPKGAEVIDLMQALKKSLNAKGGASGRSRPKRPAHAKARA